MKSRLVLYGSLALCCVLTVAVVAWLWSEHVVDVPPVAIRAMGRVAGVMSSGKASTVQLPVPVHRQEHSLSCEIATLKMALGRYGIDVPEAEIMKYLPFDTTPKRNRVWGDPHKGFVGNIDGKMLIDGYGVYWDPIARLGLRWKRTEVLRNARAVDVASHLAEGHPVIIWGNYGRATPYAWISPDGSVVQAVDGEHTRIVTGFSGPVGAPTSFSLIDPIFGSVTWSTEKLVRNWSTLGRYAVVVYPHPRWVRARGTGRVWEISKDGTTRQWVRTWRAFVARGGYKEAIVVIDNGELMRYKRGDDITLD